SGQSDGTNRSLDRFGDVVELEIGEQIGAALTGQRESRRPLLDEQLEPDLQDADVSAERDGAGARFAEARVVEREGDALFGRHRQEQSGSPGWQLQSFLAGFGVSPPPPAAGARRLTRSACALCASASFALSSARVLSSCADATCCKRSLTFCCC